MSVLERILLDREIAAWRRFGHVPRLWLRDDDARVPSTALDRLLQVLGGRPMALAVVPDGDLKPLAAALEGETSVTISQHGIDHINRRGPGEPVGEHPLGSSVETIAARVREGLARFADAGLEPLFYTPPWNRIDEALPEALLACGYRRLSAWGEASPDASPITRLDAHVDVLRWNPSPRFRGQGRVLGDLRRQLQARRRAGAFESPIGILTHHLDHDEDTWAFLDWLGEYADGRFAWRSYGELAGG